MPEDPVREPPPSAPEYAALDLAIRFGLLAYLTYVSLTLVHPFVPILAWAVILAVALYPVFSWLRARLGGHGGVAALSLTLLCLIVVFGPAAALTTSLVASLEHFAARIHADGFQLPAPPPQLFQLPLVGESLHDAWEQASGNATDFIERHGHALLVPGEWVLRMVAALAGSLLVFAIAVCVAGFLYLPGPRLVSRIRDAAHYAAGVRGRGFVDLAGATIRNVARGVIGLAVLQTLAIGIGLTVAEVPHAGLLTFVALVLAVGQIGTSPVIVPVVIWFWLARDTTPAILFTVYMLAAGALEHVLKPVMMGRGLTTPMPVILIGLLGGTIVYGLPGLFLGPMVLAVFYDLILFWAETRLGSPDDTSAGR